MMTKMADAMRNRKHLNNNCWDRQFDIPFKKHIFVNNNSIILGTYGL